MALALSLQGARPALLLGTSGRLCAGGTEPPLAPGNILMVTLSPQTAPALASLLGKLGPLGRTPAAVCPPRIWVGRRMGRKGRGVPGQEGPQASGPPVWAKENWRLRLLLGRRVCPPSTVLELAAPNPARQEGAVVRVVPPAAAAAAVAVVAALGLGLERGLGIPLGLLLVPTGEVRVAVALGAEV
jgi:hypothetical protein